MHFKAVSPIFWVNLGENSKIKGLSALKICLKTEKIFLTNLISFFQERHTKSIPPVRLELKIAL